MTVFKTGSRLKSQVDDTQLVVVRAPAGDLDLRIGGHPPTDLAGTPESGLVAEPGEGTLLGKRYTRDQGDLELLITKAGAGDLMVDGVLLHVKDSKPLPASD
jgi:hypothetical protein